MKKKSILLSLVVLTTLLISCSKTIETNESKYVGSKNNTFDLLYDMTIYGSLNDITIRSDAIVIAHYEEEPALYSEEVDIGYIVYSSRY
ncbi:MAG: hypothetical protein PHI32_14055, partial [Dysgonamonadaceae bacterium]|nr:hypothetical protein [Dysgonamonadaceae bacterium]